MKGKNRAKRKNNQYLVWNMHLIRAKISVQYISQSNLFVAKDFICGQFFHHQLFRATAAATSATESNGGLQGTDKLWGTGDGACFGVRLGPQCARWSLCCL